MPDHRYDEFGFPTTAAERLQRMRGIAPVQGEYGFSAGTNGKPISLTDAEANDYLDRFVFKKGKSDAAVS
jgi:hypothetical protein